MVCSFCSSARVVQGTGSSGGRGLQKQPCLQLINHGLPLRADEEDDDDDDDDDDRMMMVVMTTALIVSGLIHGPETPGPRGLLCKALFLLSRASSHQQYECVLAQDTCV
eukprot:2644485-Amphidinium_carterae.1